LHRYGFPRSRMHVVHSGLAERPFLEARARTAACRAMSDGDGARPKIITCVAHLKKVKNHELLLAAVRDLAETRDDFVVWLVGAGARGDFIRRLARRYGLEDKVALIGVRRDIPRILSLSDIFVLQSRWEGLPVSILEAMASGLPVVATQVGGIAELVVDQHTGLLVPSRDQAALGAALARLLDDAELRRHLGRAGQERFRSHFEQGIMVGRMDRLYRRLVARKSARRAARRRS
ncbi:MAG: glycosyltransferase, partial [Proteobacteria bacterium]|nr:glycosyltransferase [Pseudomonadota bacterium]